MKGLCTLSIDPVVATLFKSRHPGKASAMVEQFMRDALNLDVEDARETNIDSDIEKIQADLQRKKIELRALQTKRTEYEQRVQDEAEKKKKENAALEISNAQALKDITLYDWQHEFKVAQSKDQTLTADAFLKMKMGAVQ